MFEELIKVFPSKKLLEATIMYGERNENIVKNQRQCKTILQVKSS